MLTINYLLIITGLVLVSLGSGLAILIENISIWILVFPIILGSFLVTYCSLNLLAYIIPNIYRKIRRINNGTL